ncbi:MAG: hypothetical protein ACQETI_01620 [Halobacteriota archaeon]
MKRRFVLGLCGSLASSLAGCSGLEPPEADASASRPTTSTAARDDSVPAGPYGYTHLRADGNRVVGGSGRIPGIEPVDVELPGPPAWLVAAPLDDGVLWVVTLEDGSVEGFESRDGRVAPAAVSPSVLSGPPALAFDADGPASLLTHPDCSPLSHPVPISGGVAFVQENGAVSLRGSTDADFDVDALPDARLVTRGDRLFVLGGSTTSYGHGALGDAVEGACVAVVDAAAGTVVDVLEPPEGTVIESVAPLVADVDADGRAEVLVTASDDEAGARIVALRPGEGVVATGDPVGLGHRWRHLLAVAPFGPDETPEVAVVKTPHIGGTAEFYRVAGDRLELVATVRGYSTHRLGSRNLDTAAAGDFDGDGRVELLAPTDAHTHLAGVTRTDGGATESWRVPVDGSVTTNLAAASIDGAVSVGVGRADGLRLWLS